MSKPEVAAGLEKYDKSMSNLETSGKLMLYSMLPIMAGFGMLYFENRFKRRHGNYLFLKN